VRDALRALLALQDVDSELSTFEAEVAALPQKRCDLEAKRTAAEARVTTAREALEAAELVRRKLEGTLRDKEELVARLESQQFAVKSNEAYTVLLREIAAAKQAISDCETQILEELEKIDGRREALAAAQSEQRALAVELENEAACLDTRAKELEDKLPRVRTLREEAEQRVDAALLERYKRVILRRRPAVVVVAGTVCLGCHVGIPPQRYLELLEGKQVVICGSCQRILVHADVVG